LRSLGLDERASSKPLKMYTTLRPKVAAQIVPSVDSLEAKNAVLFNSLSRSPLITFDGAAGDVITRNFGGSVLSAAEITTAGQKPRTIIATTNGCISVDEP
jgi:hypothetical protein